jgi:hypothetical protein
VPQQMSGLGMAIAKRLLPVVGRHGRGQRVVRQRLARHALRPCIAPLPPGRRGMEAGGGAPAWARRFRAHPYAVTRLAPQGGTPASQANQHDRRDAAGLGAAGSEASAVQPGCP